MMDVDPDVIEILPVLEPIQGHFTPSTTPVPVPIPIPVWEIIGTLNARSELGRVIVGQLDGKEDPLVPHTTKEKWYFCRSCGRSYLSQAKMIEHEKEHPSIPNYNIPKKIQPRKNQKQKPVEVEILGQRNNNIHRGPLERVPEEDLKNCPLCDYTYIHYIQIRNHTNRAHGKGGSKKIKGTPNEDGIKKCPLCDYTYVHYIQYRGHKNRAHGKGKSKISNGKPISTSTISFSSSPSKIRKEKSINGSPTGSSCRFCKLRCSTSSNRNQHIKRCHQKESKFLCPYCSCRLRTQLSLSSHVARRHNRSISESPASRVSNPVGPNETNRQNLSPHRNLIAQKNDSSHIKCPQCPDMLKKCSLRRHLKSSHVDGIIGFSCQFCPCRMRTKRAKMAHESFKHGLRSGLQEIARQIKSKALGFSSTRSMAKMLGHHFSGLRVALNKIPEFTSDSSSEDVQLIPRPTKNPNQNWFKNSFDCKFCLVKSYQLGNYKKHMKTHGMTGDPAPWKCPHCSCPSTTRLSHYRHLKWNRCRILTGNSTQGQAQSQIESPKAKIDTLETVTMDFVRKNRVTSTLSSAIYHCFICDKRMSLAKKRSHWLQHKQEKPFKCPHCLLTFTNQANSNRHVRLNHWFSGSYACEYCDHTLSSSYNLGFHLSSFHGVKMRGWIRRNRR